MNQLLTAISKFSGYILVAVLLGACQSTTTTETAKPATRLPIVGTWKLLTGTLVEKGNTTVTDYTKGQEFIKIINDSHFSFLHHDLHKGKDSGAVYSSGGGSYTLTDSLYTEKLEYCSARQWEGNTFHFTVTFRGDTLWQHGVEKVPDAGVDRINTEMYVRVK